MSACWSPARRGQLVLHKLALLLPWVLLLTIPEVGVGVKSARPGSLWPRLLAGTCVQMSFQLSCLQLGTHSTRSPRPRLRTDQHRCPFTGPPRLDGRAGRGPGALRAWACAGRGPPVPASTTPWWPWTTRWAAGQGNTGTPPWDNPDLIERSGSGSQSPAPDALCDLSAAHWI